MIGIITTSVITKKSWRDPSALLAAAAVNPLVMLIGLCLFIGALVYLGHPEYISVQKSYKKIILEGLFQDELFRFLIGETSFNEVEEIFKNSEAACIVRRFEDTERFDPCLARGLQIERFRSTISPFNSMIRKKPTQCLFGSTWRNFPKKIFIMSKKPRKFKESLLNCIEEDFCGILKASFKIRAIN